MKISKGTTTLIIFSLTLDILVVHAHNLHSLHGGLELSNLIDAGDGDLALRQEDVVLGIFQDEVACEREKVGKR